MGLVIAYAITISPLLERGDPQMIFFVRLGLFLAAPYLCIVIALRGKDEFNMVIPYVRFVQHEVEVPLIVVDTSLSLMAVLPGFVRANLRPEPW